jgi:hypothetical protein
VLNRRLLFGKAAFVGILAFGLGLAGCTSASGPLPRIAVQSPVATALSWFNSINEHNISLARAHFVPADRQLMTWSDFGSTSFSNVHCHSLEQEATNTEVYCTFRVPNPSPDMQGVTFWDVYMQRKLHGPWLINSYGQG